MGKVKKQNKKFFFSVVGEAILNPDPKYKGLWAGRIEIWHKDYPYDIDEISIVLPQKIFEKLYDAINFKETDYFILRNVYSEELEKRVKGLKKKLK